MSAFIWIFWAIAGFSSSSSAADLNRISKILCVRADPLADAPTGLSSFTLATDRHEGFYVASLEVIKSGRFQSWRAYKISLFNSAPGSGLQIEGEQDSLKVIVHISPGFAEGTLMHPATVESRGAWEGDLSQEMLCGQVVDLAQVPFQHMGAFFSGQSQ